MCKINERDKEGQNSNYKINKSQVYEKCSIGNTVNNIVISMVTVGKHTYHDEHIIMYPKSESLYHTPEIK